MESSEKQTPRSSNAFKNKPGRGRTASHVKKSDNRTSRSKASRRTSVDSRKKSNPKCSRGKAYAKLIQTKSQRRILNGRIASRSALYRLKCRTSQAVYVTKRPYRRRIPNVNSQANTSKDILPQTNSEFGIIPTNENPVEQVQSLSCSNRPTGLKRKYTRRNPSSRFSYTRKPNARSAQSNYANSIVDFNNLVKKQEAFIRAFAIPTHLYRYLSHRHRDRPLYLDRTLSYLMPNPSRKQSSGSRRSINRIVERLIERRKDCRQNDELKDSSKYLESTSSSSSTTPGELPQELELIFEGFYDSEKEMDWVTVDASVNVHLRFGWAWRRKICPDDTILNITPNPIRINCYSHSTGYTSLVNSPPTSNNDNSTTATTNTTRTACRFSLTDLINQVKWNTSSGRLTSAQLELHVSATERRWLKRPDLSHGAVGLNGITPNISNNLTNHINHVNHNNNGNNNPSQNSSKSAHTDGKNINSHTTFISGNPLRKGGLSSNSYPVQYSTAPLPLIVSSIGFDSSNTGRQLLLTPGLYELRLGVDTSDGNVSNSGSNGRVMNKVVPLKCLDDNTSEKSYVSANNDKVNDACSGQVEWRRIRFPNSSTALDEYSRWPGLRFSVIWHNKLENNQITSPCRSMETRRQDNTHMHAEGRSSLTRSMTNSHNRDVIKLQNQSVTPHKQIVLKESCDSSVYKDSTGLDKCLSNRVQQSLSAYSGPDVDKPTSTKTPPLIHPITYGFVFGGNLQQWSQSTDLVCPWCHLDCARAGDKGPEALVLHLRTCHPRFRLKVMWDSSHTQLSLQVSLNEAYDGSNDCGIRRWCPSGRNIFILRHHVIPSSSGQLVGSCAALGTNSNPKQSGNQGRHSNSPTIIDATVRIRCPVRRLPYTHLIFWRGAELSTDQLLDPTLSVRPMVTGHNRIYYHTRTSQPVRACEFDVDSEAEDAPVWLRQHYQRKVEEFTDVNPGEKQIMQLWNALLLSIRPSGLVVCDGQVLTLVCQFIHQHSRWIHRRRLRTNLLLHLVNLVDYGLLSSSHLRQLMLIYDKHVQELNPINNTSVNNNHITNTQPLSSPSNASTTSLLPDSKLVNCHINKSQPIIPRLLQMFSSTSNS
uniref:VEFS-Box domain-containing protein n=1 Tax=Schistosoma mansoni TaxID=6183 RepID=A0A3Q0KFJ5_SCHMA